MALGNVLSIKGGGYPQGGSAAGRNAPITDPEGENKDGFWPLEKCINAYTTYLDNKTLEIKEQQNARRYRHGAQWTSDQIKTFNDRKQPVVTYNKIGARLTASSGWWNGSSRIRKPTRARRSSRPAPTSPPRCCAI